MESVEENMAVILAEKAEELFKICDQEQKGFICKRDMQRMLKEMPMDPEELEDVFDSLDVDGNGFLTLEEFTTGFGRFLGLPDLDDQESPRVPTANSSNDEQRREMETIVEHNMDEDEEFLEFLVSSGASEIVGDNDEGVKQLWRALRSGGVSTLQALTSILKESSEKLQRAKNEQLSLENAMKQQYDALNEQIQTMSEEMEAQIAAEKEKKLEEMNEQENKARQDMESQLALKDLQLRMTNKRFSETEAELKKLTALDGQQKSELEELHKQREKLEEQLNNQRIVIEDLKNSIHQTRSSVMDERKKRAMAALSVTETIAQEREDLVKQLGMLKTVNARLMDDKDTSSHHSPQQGKRYDSGSNIGAKSPSPVPRLDLLDVPDSGMPLEESDCEIDDVYVQTLQGRIDRPPKCEKPEKSSRSGHMKGSLLLRPSSSLMDELCQNEPLSSEITTKSSSNRGDINTSTNGFLITPASAESGSEYNRLQIGTVMTPASQTASGLPYDTSAKSESSMMTISSSVSLNTQPQRVYKVIIIGDAGVGKTCFVQRICTGEVDFNYATTIGVDFRVHTIVLDEKTVSIQLWDTAGQERYRSITKQYFRKADGVFVTFDVTSENSFKNCRQWIDSVKELAAVDVSTVLLGNKLDLCPDAEKRVITPHQAAQLASSYGCIYMECSATVNIGVTEAIETMARSLMQREDDNLEKSIKLVANVTPKRACCK